MMSPWKELLNEFRDRINSEASILAKYATAPEPPFSSTLFDPPFYVRNVDERNPGRGRPGIYFFFLLNDVSLTDEQVRKWNNAGGAGFKQQYGTIELIAGDCLYLGSAEDSLMKRLADHFGPLISNGNSKGLALSLPQRQILTGKVQAVAFPVKSGYEQYASLFLTQVEKRLHSTMMPKARSSKV